MLETIAHTTTHVAALLLAMACLMTFRAVDDNGVKDFQPGDATLLIAVYVALLTGVVVVAHPLLSAVAMIVGALGTVEALRVHRGHRA